MAYTTIDKPTDYFNTKLYTGNGSTQSITGVGFAPDWVWIRDRDQAYSHNLYDTVRGANKILFSDTTAQEDTSTTNRLTSFNSDGFTLGSGNAVNKNTHSHVSWNWLGANGTASNSDGSITSTVSANTTAGFSIVSYTGTGSASTVGHGLSSTPQVYIIKNRTNARNWQSYHEPLGNQAYLRLNTTGSASTGASIWNNTSPTSSVFSIGTSSFNAVNSSGDNYIAYCFAEKKGFSKFGSYTGNGNADGTFVYTGFKPAWFLVKNTSISRDWQIFDNKRLGYNVDNNYLFANLSDAEGTADRVDLLSSGVKWRTSANTYNASGNNYIFMAFAENPFVTSSGVPSCAR